MKIRVKVWGRGEEERELPEGASVEKLLEGMEIDREAVVVRVNGRICPESEKLSAGDEVLIIPIVTGG